jgi:rubrerythrin
VCDATGVMTSSQRYASLRSLFRAAVSLGLVGAGGCSQRISPADFSETVCRNGVYTPLEGLTLPAGTDFVALREEDDTFPGQPPPSAAPTTLASTGTACATATDRTACTTALDALRSDAGWVNNRFGNEIPRHRYVVFTRGSTVSSIPTVDALAAFLAPIDAPAEAALLASERGYRILCDGNNLRRVGEGFELRVQTGHTCGRGTGIDHHVVAIDRAGALTVRETVRVEDGDPNCVIGRRVEGVALPADGPSRSLGEYLARAAALEAASVPAFERLGRELRALGAPAGLVRAAERSAREEVRHATVTAREASRFGGALTDVTVPPLPVRDAFAVALENAVEGCVRETFGALQATWQAEHARDAALAEMFRTIARDETRHAALAWEVAAWLEARLDPAQRAAVETARAEAVASLRRALAAEPLEAVVVEAGVPTAHEALRLYDAVAAPLWQA